MTTCQGRDDDLADTAFTDFIWNVESRDDRRHGGPQTMWLPQVEPLLELPKGRTMWCPVRGMYGGFALRWDDGAIHSESWCRVDEGSGQRHRVTANGVELVEDGIR